MSQTVIREGVTRRLAVFLAAARLEIVPADVVTRSKHLILDGIGCALAGVSLPWCRKAVEALTSLEPQGTATVWGHDRQTSPGTAAVLNGTAVQAWEMDDYHLLGPLHVESVVVTSALATAEHLGDVPGRALLEAIVFGQEVGPRVGMALGGMALINRGWHNGAIFGTVASAVASAKLRGLDADGMEDALGLAGTQACGLMAAQYEAMVTYMHHGFAARSGVIAAALAERQFTGVRRIFEREYGGLAANFSDPHAVDLGFLERGLGTSWEIRRIAVKPYACMAGVHIPIEASQEMLRARGHAVEDIDRIEIRVAQWLHRKGSHRLERSAPVVSAQMSIPYGVAVALLDNQALPPQYTAARIQQDDVWRLMERVDVVWDPTIDALGPNLSFLCRMAMRFRDGGVERREVPFPLGSHERPLGNEAIVEKFRRVVSGVLDQERRRCLEEVILHLEDHRASDLVALLGRKVAAP